VPRPETESVVQYAVDALQGVPAPLCVDLCTGSGTIAFALANELPGAVVHAVERDPTPWRGPAQRRHRVEAGDPGGAAAPRQRRGRPARLRRHAGPGHQQPAVRRDDRGAHPRPRGRRPRPRASRCGRARTGLDVDPAGRAGGPPAAQARAGCCRRALRPPGRRAPALLERPAAGPRSRTTATTPAATATSPRAGRGAADTYDVTDDSRAGCRGRRGAAARRARRAADRHGLRHRGRRVLARPRSSGCWRQGPRRDMPVPVLVGSWRGPRRPRRPRHADDAPLVEAFWPGPADAHRAGRAVAGLGPRARPAGTVAVRMPLHPVALDVLDETGPLAVSSANRTARRRRRRPRRPQEQLGASVASTSRPAAPAMPSPARSWT
jgi:hypothetical protein